uniref:Prokaryotic-type class I peptide chain release factors domain-containing protein n=1 Tax=Strigamia maritima TaxID=126957 RepID=T1JJ78_STRMM
MYPSFYASATLARNFTPRRPWMNVRQMLFYDYRSAYSLDKVYPNSSLQISKQVQTPEHKDNNNQFTGYIPVDQLEITYSRSAGPGGQNVNKVNSKVDVRFHVATAKWLDANIKEKILEKHRDNMNNEGYLIFRSDKTRTQMLNLADCLDKIRNFIWQACLFKCKVESKEMEMVRLASSPGKIKNEERTIIYSLRYPQCFRSPAAGNVLLCGVGFPRFRRWRESVLEISSFLKMPPKKRDKEPDAGKHSVYEQMQADHELFLQAFEKPTQIYRYLRTRNLVSPIFLERTLSYMKHRMSRTHKKRARFKSASILDTILAKNKEIQQEEFSGFMTLTFTGFLDPNKNYDAKDSVLVETILLKICHKKRKDVASPIMQTSFGKSEVACNPDPSNPPLSSWAVSVPSNTFNLNNNGHLVKSYVLLLRVSSATDGATRNGEDEDETPPAKKARRNGRATLTDSTTAAAGTTSAAATVNMFGAELIVYDKHNRCLLTDGQYELVLQQVATKGSSPRKSNSWETFLDSKEKQTEAREDLHCPWCSLNCAKLYSLLKHLKTCHSRFVFTYTAHSKGARIDVSINECYDGSYAGNPHEIHTPGFAFSRNGPVRRTPVTNVMVCRPKRPPPSLSEFLEPDDSEFDGPRPYVTGHNRLYHHTLTCLPVRPQEIDVDSEGENDPNWLRTKTKLMIDEFTDVNEGEKELMKIWNLHVMKQGFVGDCQISLACSMFVQNHGREVIERNLYKNFILHMSSLYDFGLITGVVIYQTIRELQVLADSI